MGVKGTPLKPVIYVIALCAMLCSSLVNATLLNIQPESVEAEAWTIIDTESGQVIAEHNSHVQRAPASLTKMMVAYITLKEIQAGRLNPQEILTATHVVDLVQPDESQMHLKPGEKISVDELLAALIVMSANDGALLLAEHISGNVPAFVEKMNQEAKNLGMKDTHFQNPPGITMPQHYSSAADLALLSQALVNETPQYLHYSKMPSFSYGQIFHHATNLLLARDPSVDGLKTGFTKAAGYNLALTANRPTQEITHPERRLVVVVLGTKSAHKRADIAHRLLNLAYTYTRNQAITKANQHLADLPVSKSTTVWYPLAPQDAKVATLALYPHAQPIDLRQFNQATQRIELTDEAGHIQTIEPLVQSKIKLKFELKQHQLVAPISKVMPLALIHVYQDNRLIQSIPIDEDVQLKEATMWQQVVLWFEGLLSLIYGESQDPRTYPLR